MMQEIDSKNRKERLVILERNLSGESADDDDR